MSSLVGRMVRAAKLENALYDEVEHDASAMPQAALVVLIASALAGLGSALLHFSLVGLIVGIVGTFVGWVIWSLCTWFIGTRVFKGTADVGEMLRVLGFAYTPMVLGIFPIVGAFIGAIWCIVCGVVAVRQGLDISTGKAIGTVLLALLPAIAILAAINAIVF